MQPVRRALASLAFALVAIGSSVAVHAEDVRVGAYYYPWYSAPEAREGRDERGWLRKALRGRLVPRQEPALGIYDSSDPKVVAEHIAQSRRGNIDFWVVSWWGPGTTTDRAFRDDILPHPDASKLDYALFYEPTGRLGSFDRPDYDNFLPDLRYLVENYVDHERYLKLDGRPVVFIYLTRVYFRDRGLDTLKELREEFPKLYLVGDDVFGPGYRAEHARLWDAVTSYDVYGQSLQGKGGTSAALEQLKKNYARAQEVANEVGAGFVPAVSPGFNDRAVRDGHAGRARHFTDREDSREGDIFRAMLREVALPHADPRAGRMVMVTSFNEWYEDTQIEPTKGKADPTAKDDSPTGKHYTEGEKYVDYGTLYLDILREETSKR